MSPYAWSLASPGANTDESLSAFIVDLVPVESPEQAVEVMKRGVPYSPLLYGKNPDGCPDAKYATGPQKGEPKPRSSRVWDGRWGQPCIGTNHRHGAHFESVSFMVLDVDNGATIAEVQQRLLGFRYAIVTTRSHLKDKGGVVAERFRIVLWLDKPITDPAEYLAAWRWATERFTGSKADEQAKDVARFYFASPADAQVFTGEGVAVVIPSDLMVKRAAEYAQLPAGDADNFALYRALKYMERQPLAVSKDGGHSTTLRVAMAAVRGFNLTDEQALVVMQTYNDRLTAAGEETWSETELAHKVESARLGNHNSPPFGYLLTAGQSPKAGPANQDQEVDDTEAKREPIAGPRLAAYVHRRLTEALGAIKHAKKNRAAVTQQQCQLIGRILTIPDHGQLEAGVLQQAIDAATYQGAGPAGLNPQQAPALVGQWIGEGRLEPLPTPTAYPDLPGSEFWAREDFIFVGEVQGYFRRRPNGRWDTTRLTRDALEKVLIGEGASRDSIAYVLEQTAHPTVTRIGIHASPKTIVVNKREGGFDLNMNPHGVVKPVEGEFPTIRRLMELVVGPENVDWLLNYGAFVAQFPNERPMVAPNIYGPPGSGKTELGKLLGYCRGTWVEIGQSELFAHFNASWAGAPFIVASEIALGETKHSDLQRLKRLVTDQTVPRAIKFGSEDWVPNRSAYWITSNDPIEVEAGDRRYACFKATKDVAFLDGPWTQTFESYPESKRHLWPELQALRYHLLHRQVDKALLKRIPQTAARKEAELAGMNSVERFVHDCEENGYTSVTKGLEVGATDLAMSHHRSEYSSTFASSSHIYAVYVAHAKSEGKAPFSKPKFEQRLPWPTDKQRLQVPASIGSPTMQSVQFRGRKVPEGQTKDQDGAA